MYRRPTYREMELMYDSTTPEQRSQAKANDDHNREVDRLCRSYISGFLPEVSLRMSLIALGVTHEEVDAFIEQSRRPQEQEIAAR